MVRPHANWRNQCTPIKHETRPRRKAKGRAVCEANCSTELSVLRVPNAANEAKAGNCVPTGPERYGAGGLIAQKFNGLSQRLIDHLFVPSIKSNIAAIGHTIPVNNAAEGSKSPLSSL